MIRQIPRRALVVDVVIAAGILIVGFPASVAFGTAEGLSGALTLAGLCAALAIRRLSPGFALLTAWAVAVAEMAFHVQPGPANLLILGILYATAAFGSRAVRWVGFASAWVGAACVAIYVAVFQRGLSSLFLNGIGGILDALGTAAFAFGAAAAGFLLAWTAGVLAETWRRGRTSRLAAVAAEREVVAEQERTRIARDMHDVVAHSLAVVIAQADGARYLRKTSPEAVDEALVTIASTARDALADVRVLLAQLRHSQGVAPQPALHDLDRLYEQLRAAGLDLVVEESGAPLTVGTGIQLAIYRIVQESLTNALRHGDSAAPVSVRFDWAPGGLHLAIANAVRAGAEHPGQADAASVTGRGHGLAGMTERANLVGGSLATEASGGRFVVRAWLPGGAPSTGAVGAAGASRDPAVVAQDTAGAAPHAPAVSRRDDGPDLTLPASIGSREASAASARPSPGGDTP